MTRTATRRRPAGARVRLLTVVLLATAVSAFGGGRAPMAVAASPAWKITSSATPTNFQPGSGNAAFVVTATNVGDAPTTGPIVVADTVPAPTVAPVEILGIDDWRINREAIAERLPLKCTLKKRSCEFAKPVIPGDSLTVVVRVSIVAGPTPATVTNVARVSGGGAATARTGEPTTVPTPVTTAAVAFGMSGYFNTLSSNLAASHPDITTSMYFNERAPNDSAASLRDVDVSLPPGVVGDPLATPRCDADGVARFECPPDTAVGVATTEAVPHLSEGRAVAEPFVSLIYNITPYPDEPAAFAFNTLVLPVRLDTSVVRESDGQYATHVKASTVAEDGSVISAMTTFWGAPAEHNGAGADQLSPKPALELEQVLEEPGFGAANGETPVPFLTAPSVCSGDPLTEGLLPLTSTTSIDSWQAPGRQLAQGVPDLSDPGWRYATSAFETPTGCERLSFQPTVALAPETLQAGAPSGYTLDVRVPQTSSTTIPATPPLQSAVVTLPAGTLASPSAASGLEACSDSSSSPAGDQFQLASSSAAACPRGSQIGRVSVTTPLLSEPLTGQLFLATPECAPCSTADAREGRMIRLLLQAQGSGVTIKVQGTVSVDQSSGRLTATFRNNPQFPFSDLRIVIDGGPRAALTNPSTCGIPESLTSELTPYSSPRPATPSSEPFEVGNCPPERFAPTFAAGTTDNQAGAYSPFTATVARTDDDGELSAIQVTTPPGLLGTLASVPLCGEAQAAAGSCPAASQIGHTTVLAGAGSSSLALPIPGGPATPVYLTGPYKGAPFGLSFVVPAVAGPFNLGTVVVRAAIHVDPVTGAVTITSDPLPSALDGVPLKLRTVGITIDRSGFMFNPTSCSHLRLAGLITSTTGAAAPVANGFQAAGCATLPFKPSFSASTQGNGTTKGNGASLDVRVATNEGPSSNASAPAEANIARVDVQLPLALPSRLTTLQQACLAAQFASNPAGCPAASDVGTAVARTPVLPVPLEGPAYLVSHGGAAFPDLVVVLQGDGVVIDLTGHTQIKNGITYSHFETVPDAPVTSFELKLPERHYSVLAAETNLCKQTRTVTVRKRVTTHVQGRAVTRLRSVTHTIAAPLLMPTKITAQNGAVVSQATKIAVTACPRLRAPRRGRKAAQRRYG